MIAWNEDALIRCEFAFKCPQVWDRLEPTAVDTIRHCLECDRNVHLAVTQAEFRRAADEGLCVAVRVVSPSADSEAYILGNPHPVRAFNLKSV